MTIDVDGTTYAVNGIAKGGDGVAKNKDIELVWAAGDTAGLKKDIGPFIERGLALCK